jgi:hypothetical protein
MRVLLVSLCPLWLVAYLQLAAITDPQRDYGRAGITEELLIFLVALAFHVVAARLAWRIRWRHIPDSAVVLAACYAATGVSVFPSLLAIVGLTALLTWRQSPSASPAQSPQQGDPRP